MSRSKQTTNKKPSRSSKHQSKASLAIDVAKVTILVITGLVVWSVIRNIGALEPELDPESPAINSSRNDARESITNSLTEIEDAVGLSYYSESSHDMCYEGQNNWKVNDGYDQRCTYRITRFYGFNDSFAKTMINFENSINNLGWRSPEWETDQHRMRELVGWYEKNRVDKDYLSSPNFPRGYLVSNLPTPIGGYERSDAILEIEYAERKTQELSSIDYAQSVTRGNRPPFYEREDFQDIDKLFKTITKKNVYMLVVSVQINYHDK